jgi:hypothetical protein
MVRCKRTRAAPHPCKKCISQAAANAFDLAVSGGSSRGAKIRTFGFDIESPVENSSDTDADERWDQLSSISASLNTRSQRASSFRMKAANSSGVLLTALMPVCSSRPVMLASSYILAISL